MLSSFSHKLLFSILNLQNKWLISGHEKRADKISSFKKYMRASVRIKFKQQMNLCPFGI